MAKKRQKKSRAAKRKGVSTPAKSKKAYPTSGFTGHGGFHAKAPSQLGADRARSMGNRLNKGS